MFSYLTFNNIIFLIRLAGVRDPLFAHGGQTYGQEQGFSQEFGHN
jgi:hypothetical protein